MATALSNASAQVIVQDTDLLNAGFSVLAKAFVSTVTFPAGNGVFYSGYSTVTTGTTLFGLIAVPFVYIRNATQGGNNGVVINFQQVGSVVVSSLNLAPGSVFLYANPVTSILGNNNPCTVQNFVYGPVLSSQPVTVEYMYAY